MRRLTALTLALLGLIYWRTKSIVACVVFAAAVTALLRAEPAMAK